MSYEHLTPRVAWAGPVSLTWTPEDGTLRLTAWKANRVAGAFTLRVKHLTPEAVALLRTFIETASVGYHKENE